MPFVTRCPHCRTKLRSSRKPRNKIIHCPKCNKPFQADDQVYAEIESGDQIPTAPAISADPNAMNTFPQGEVLHGDNLYSSPNATKTQNPKTDWVRIPDQEIEKIEAILKDAKQVTIGILMCLFLVAIGGFIIGPWYFYRAIQWNSFSKKYPFLVDPNAARDSLAGEFTSAKSNLYLGVIIGAIFITIYTFGIAVVVLAAHLDSTV